MNKRPGKFEGIEYPIEITDEIDDNIGNAAAAFKGPLVRTLHVNGHLADSDQTFVEILLTCLAASQYIVESQIKTALAYGVPQEEIDRYINHAKVKSEVVDAMIEKEWDAADKKNQ